MVDLVAADHVLDGISHRAGGGPQGEGEVMDTSYGIMLELMVTIACREAARTHVMHGVMRGPAGWWVRHPAFPAGSYEWVATAAPGEVPEAVLARVAAREDLPPFEAAPPPPPPRFYRAEPEPGPATCRTTPDGPARQAGFQFDD